MPHRVCIDASLAISWIVRERFTDSALALRRSWARDTVELVVPPIFPSEVTSTIRRTVYQGAISPEDGRRALERALAWPVTVSEDGDDLQRQAYELATRFNRPRAYDAQYLAVAQAEGSEFWTGDERLINSLQGQLAWAHWIGDYKSP
jgi:predicted nucleic acid-binding protein